jgi:hypothetical protein
MQETFNTIVRHLRAQGGKAQVWDEVKQNYMCYYRLGDLKCAAGCIIPDEFYMPDMEHKRILRVDEEFSLNLPDIMLVERMQGIHDNCPVPEWEAKFEEVAKEFGLVVPD